MRDTDYDAPYRELKVFFISGEVDTGTLKLPRDLGEQVAYSAEPFPGLVADFTREDRMISLEFREPAAISAEDVDEVLREHGHPPLEEGELDPILAPHRLDEDAAPGGRS